MTNGWKWTTSNGGSNVSSFSSFRCYSYALYPTTCKKKKVNITLESSFKVGEYECTQKLFIYLQCGFTNILLNIFTLQNSISSPY